MCVDMLRILLSILATTLVAVQSAFPSCTPNPCQHEGECSTQDGRWFHCECKAVCGYNQVCIPWVGRTCELDGRLPENAEWTAEMRKTGRVVVGKGEPYLTFRPTYAEDIALKKMYEETVEALNKQSAEVAKQIKWNREFGPNSTLTEEDTAAIRAEFAAKLDQSVKEVNAITLAATHKLAVPEQTDELEQITAEVKESVTAARLSVAAEKYLRESKPAPGPAGGVWPPPQRNVLDEITDYVLSWW